MIRQMANRCPENRTTISGSLVLRPGARHDICRKVGIRTTLGTPIRIPQMSNQVNFLAASP